MSGPSPAGAAPAFTALGTYVHDRAVRSGDAVAVGGFFAELDRYATPRDGIDAGHH